MFFRTIATKRYELLQFRTILLLTLLSSCVDALGAGSQECVDLAISSPFYGITFDPSGILVGYVPYLVCKELCPGWTHFPLQYIAFLVIQFILPTIIFAMVIPRRWHLDVPPGMFTFGHGGILAVLKLFSLLILMLAVACVDLILWASAIMAFSGPMIFSVLHELYLDGKILGLLRAPASQKGQLALTELERLDLLVALVCGQFSGSLGNTITRIRAAFAVPLDDDDALELCKTRLKCVITSQATFGATMGIAALFYLGGILYTASGILQATAQGNDATPYALWLITMIYVAIVASTPITGTAPSVVNVLTNLPGHKPRFAWCPCLIDYYRGELYPTAMWDRGKNKLEWLLDSQVKWNHGSFADKVKLGKTAWAGLYITAVFLSIFPSIMAFELAYNIPNPREGCRTLSYATYIACQVWLITITSTTSLEWNEFPVPDAGLDYDKPWQKCLRILSYSVAISTTALAAILAFLVSFLGTIFQIFGVYNNCFCQTAVSTWTRPAAQRRTQITFRYTGDHESEASAFTSGITWAAAGVTLTICFLSWLYQKVISATVMEEIEQL